MLDQRHALGPRHVDGNGSLVAAGGEIVAALPVVLSVGILQEGWSPAADLVAGSRAFDFDDVGAEVTQDLSARRRRQNPAEIEHANTCQRSWLGF